MKQVFLYIELLIIFLLIPTLFILQILLKNYMFFVLWLGSLYALYHIKKSNLNLFKGFKFDELKVFFKSQYVSYLLINLMYNVKKWEWVKRALKVRLYGNLERKIKR